MRKGRMHRRGGVLPIVAAGLLAGPLAAGAASAQEQPAEGRISLELNRAEEQAGGCRVYFVLDNGTADAFESFKLDLVAFGPDGVILRNVATEMAPLRPDKRVVKRFDLAELHCAGIGALLVNDVLECSVAGAARADCVDLLAVTSRADIELAK